MKYLAALLLALFSLTAASILQEQEGVSGYNYNNNNQNNNNNNDNNYNNNNNRNNNNNNSNNNSGNNNNQGNQQLLDKQLVVLRLLTNLQHNNPYQDLVQLGRNFNPYQNINRFYNQPAVNHFLNNLAQNNFLPRDEVFTPSSQHHQNQVAQLFHFFYSAQDWETFKAAAAWARDRINPQQFAYAFSAAVLNHPATQGVVIPALYEIIPHDFVPATAVHKIYKAKFAGYSTANVFARYTNQNENNKNYNDHYLNNNNNNNNNGQNNNNNGQNNNNNGQNNNNENNNNNNNYGTHNPNGVFAVNDGSQDNNAGTQENPENRVSYFTEDVGINAYHAGFHVQNPAFFGSNNNNNYFDNIFKTNNQNNNNRNQNSFNNNAIRRGEAFYYAHQQLYARYVLERLSNNLPIPQPINFNDKIQTGYNPNLQYANGQAVPARPPNTHFQQQQKNNNNNNNNAQEPNNNQAQHPQVYEQRLQEVADTGFVKNPDGSKTNIHFEHGVGVLANIAAVPADSPNPAYYGNYFAAGKNAIGFIVDPNNQNGVAPGPAANYATAPRDPAYYQFLAKLNQIFYNFQNNLGPYNPNQLNFPGVKIQNLDVSRLITYFDNFNVNVDNVVNTNNNNNNNGQNTNNNNAQYNVKFQRLTNQPFNYRLTVQSDKNTDAVVRVFIGPKYDSNGQQFTLPQASQYFVQLDQFRVQLNNGVNVIQRNSQQSPLYTQDAPSFQQIRNQVEQARQGRQPYFGNQVTTKFWGLPQRAQLPKGKPNGQEFIFYAIVTHANANNNNVNNNNYNSNQNNNENNNNYNNQNNNNQNNNYNRNNNNQNNNNQNNNNQNNNNQIYDIQYQDNKSLGFPFDRPVVDSYYNTPNQYFKTVTIYHKTNNNNNNNNINNNNNNSNN